MITGCVVDKATLVSIPNEDKHRIFISNTVAIDSISDTRCGNVPLYYDMRCTRYTLHRFNQEDINTLSTKQERESTYYSIFKMQGVTYGQAEPSRAHTRLLQPVSYDYLFNRSVETYLQCPRNTNLMTILDSIRVIDKPL